MNEDTRNQESSPQGRQKYPTLFVGIAVLLVTVMLLSGRSIIADAKNGKGFPIGTSENPNAVNTQTTNGMPTTAGLPLPDPVEAEVKDGVQYVTTTLRSNGYDPIQVQQGIPVKWTINVPQEAVNSCNNAIISPAFDINVTLNPGENIIEFTPDESGTFVFSCWMGMLRSNIVVADENGEVADNADDGSSQLPAGCGSDNGSGGAGCGTGGGMGGCCGS